MQVILEYTTLLQIDPSQVSVPSKEIQFITEYTTSLLIHPSQVSADFASIVCTQLLFYYDLFS